MQGWSRSSSNSQVQKGFEQNSDHVGLVARQLHMCTVTQLQVLNIYAADLSDPVFGVAYDVALGQNAVQPGVLCQAVFSG